MSEIHLHRKHKLGIRRARAAANKVAEDLAHEYDLSSEWNGDTLHFNRAGVKGTLQVSGNDVRLDVKLGILLSPFRHRIEHHVQQNLEQLFA
ncbi:MAG: polyhydroxyalkanoic acid system family protein [Burkholderiales bacterium]|nr:MAG: polyhydroxyalkanoic acid system family protein [Burkholderiales bacterium]